MSEDHERRISTVEANYGTLAQSMQNMERYMAELFKGQSAIQTSVALVVQNQDGMKEYQKSCDKERGDHEKRITATEGFQVRLIKWASAVTVLGSVASPTISKAISRLLS